MNAQPGYGFADAWKAVAAQGVIALLLGLILIFAPITTLLTLAVLFGVFALLDGITAVAALFTARHGESRWPLVAYAAAGIIVGILAIVWPGLTVALLATLVGIWAIVAGIMRIAASLRGTPYERHWSQWLVGIAAIVLGLYILFSPAGLAVLVFGLGIYAIVKGVLLLIASSRMRSMGRRLRERGMDEEQPRRAA
ncbi:MAG TPA: HdeD family acid-resistance protein [Longimicrobiales bacterium]|nr:HdeD family acid-resistance protein [Longimicrobiales bacterium]